MANSRSDMMAPPWWKAPGTADYTKRRTGALGYSSMDALIGRKDATKYKPVTSDPGTDTAPAGDLLAS